MAEQVISLLTGLVLGYLFLLSIFSTTLIDAAEHSYLIGDKPVLHLLTAALILVLGCFLRQRRFFQDFAKHLDKDDDYAQRYQRLFLILIAALALILVLCIRRHPKSDQKDIFDCVAQWRAGNYVSLVKGGYLQRYQNQLGMTILLYYLAPLIGEDNYLVIQLLNIGALVVLSDSLAGIAVESGRSRTFGLSILGLCLLFVPAALYTTFAYGTLMGLACAAAALRCFVRFLRDRKWKHMMPGLVLAFLSVILKQNYAIFLLGMALYVLLVSIREKRKMLLLPVLGLVLILLVQGSAMRGLTKMITGHTVDKGVSSWSFVAMGMQDNNDRYDGWYNQYNYVSYTQAAYDSDVQAEWAKEYIKKRLSDFMEHPGKGLRFFAGKNASQWNNPNFQGDWINFVDPNEGQAYDISHAQWVDCLLSEPGAYRMAQVMNILQSEILLGALLFLCSGERRDHPYLCFSLIFLGGFVFHTFWEAKAQYTWPYFVLLFPLSADGWDHFITWTERSWDSWNEKTDTPSRIRQAFCNKTLAVVAALLIMTLAIGSGKLPFCNIVFNRNEDTAIYMERLRQKTLSFQEDQEQKQSLTVLVSDDRQSMTISLRGYSEYAEVYFPVWSEENGQDDIVWYRSDRSEHDDCWTYTIDLSNHNPGGIINIHVYGSNGDSTRDMVLLKNTLIYVENTD